MTQETYDAAQVQLEFITNTDGLRIQGIFLNEIGEVVDFDIPTTSTNTVSNDDRTRIEQLITICNIQTKLATAVE